MWYKKKLRADGFAHRAAIGVVLLAVVVALLLLVNRHHIVDQITVWQYQPSAEIASLADRSKMNDQGKFYFYASQPALENAASFNQKCTRKEQSVAILGCYNGRFIYIYNVVDSKLDGIREVTAAHEMLHAAYDRLSEEDKKRVNALLEAEYEKLKNDKKFSERMAFYARTEPGERENELHSVIGTEVEVISAELETYYRRYFADRGQVVKLHHQYAKVFTELQARADGLVQQITALADEIEANTVEYNKEVTRLNHDIQSFNSRAESGGFSSEEEFNATRSSLIGRADQLDAMRESINGKVGRYEALRVELQQIASQSEALNKSIDSTLAPPPSI